MPRGVEVVGVEGVERVEIVDVMLVVEEVEEVRCFMDGFASLGCIDLEVVEGG